MTTCVVPLSQTDGNIKHQETVWTGATNNVTNWFCIHMDTVYTAVCTFAILHEGLLMAACGVLLFPLSPHISIPPLHCALCQIAEPSRTHVSPSSNSTQFCSSTTHVALRCVTPPLNCCFQVKTRGGNTERCLVGLWVQVDWRHTLTEGDAAFEILRK